MSLPAAAPATAGSTLRDHRRPPGWAGQARPGAAGSAGISSGCSYSLTLLPTRQPSRCVQGRHVPLSGRWLSPPFHTDLVIRCLTQYRSVLCCEMRSYRASRITYRSAQLPLQRSGREWVKQAFPVFRRFLHTFIHRTPRTSHRK
ncbi:uncharacterized protein LOC113943419 isoform X2 [Corapipo altera]|uniref:uncharacterized protein LOC113943419 isoform X2 n=1 Tax=Corapipo altera TaxID=415028 RepID=UPI000FD65DEF|nr:uncharacterized protein LOC113943419 isoform X2 [Corapipo altera]